MFSKKTLVLPWVLPRVIVRAAVLFFAVITTCEAFEIEELRVFGPADATHQLKVISTADTELFAPLIEHFIANSAETAVEYIAVSSTSLMQAIYQDKEPFDIAISSAMDLQTKLANDGYTRAHISEISRQVPGWAKWRNHVFAFTQEPAAIVYSPEALAGLPVPQTRQQLITLLRNHPQKFQRRVGTYDVRTSGLGYLFATHDARSSDIYWRLSEVMGSLNVRLYCCSGAMIEDIISGELAIAYNVLGSYAEARKKQGAEIEIIEPDDFTTVMLRSALIPANAQSPSLAGLFIDHLISASWLNSNADYYPFPEISKDPASSGTAHRPIRLGPGLLVYLDKLKRKRFMQEWVSSMIQ
ncbi:ABC transporter substrate-binding protein [Chromatiales bacterium (ex Bugula neritina AB1)]|nr:ABC transporter substrate-binding protein [Chromatiales bacterium (ex Bugula neritina AB1)]